MSAKIKFWTKCQNLCSYLLVFNELVSKNGYCTSQILSLDCEKTSNSFIWSYILAQKTQSHGSHKPNLGQNGQKRKFLRKTLKWVKATPKVYAKIKFCLKCQNLCLSLLVFDELVSKTGHYTSKILSLDCE